MIKADIELINGSDCILAENGHLKMDQIRRTNCSALVDSGLFCLAINEEIQSQLELRIKGKQLVELANGQFSNYDIVSPVIVRFSNRECEVEALVLPGNSEVLLGAIPMEYMDVVIDMRAEKLTVNPLHPYKAVVKLKNIK